MKRILLAALLSGCSTAVQIPLPKGTELQCADSEKCINEAQLACALGVFADNVPGFDLEEALLVIVEPESFTIQEYGDIVLNGVTMDASTIRTIPAALAHELIHIQLWRVFGDGDANHEEEGGAWRDEYHELARVLRIKMLEQCEVQ